MLCDRLRCALSHALWEFTVIRPTNHRKNLSFSNKCDCWGTRIHRYINTKVPKCSAYLMWFIIGVYKSHNRVYIREAYIWIHTFKAHCGEEVSKLIRCVGRQSWLYRIHNTYLYIVSYWSVTSAFARFKAEILMSCACLCLCVRV